MKTTIIVIGLVAAVGGWALLRNSWGSPASGAAPDEALFSVKRGKLTVTLTENGSLMAKKSEKINFQGKRGGGKITFLIEEGKTVEAGEVLGRLETREMENQAQQLEMDIKKTEVELKSAETEYDIQKGENVANIEKARIALDKANNELEKYRDGDAPKEQRSLEIKIKEAETTFSRSKKKYEDSKKLLEQEFINKAQVEQDEIEFQRADIALDGAKNDLELFNKYTFPMTMTEKQTAVSDARRALENAEKRAQSTLEQKEVTVKGTEQRLSVQKRNLQETKEEIEKFTIKTPAPGIVLHGDPQQRWWSERMKLGAEVYPGQTMFTIPDLRVMQVQVQVHEADINKLKEGQKATVTMDTYPGLVLKGQVSKIAQVAGSQNPWDDDNEVKKFTVDVTMDETPDHKLKPGISAKAEIFIDERADALFVPRQAVFLEEGTHYCFVMRDGSPQRSPVKIDLSNDTYTQINEGVKEGDRVLLYNPKVGVASASSADGKTPAPGTATTQTAKTP